MPGDGNTTCVVNVLRLKSSCKLRHEIHIADRVVVPLPTYTDTPSPRLSLFVCAAVVRKVFFAGMQALAYLYIRKFDRTINSSSLLLLVDTREYDIDLAGYPRGGQAPKEMGREHTGLNYSDRINGCCATMEFHAP